MYELYRVFNNLVTTKEERGTSELRISVLILGNIYIFFKFN